MKTRHLYHTYVRVAVTVISWVPSMRFFNIEPKAFNARFDAESRLAVELGADIKVYRDFHERIVAS